MPLGLRVLRKVEDIVREEMNRAGALELLMPGVIPPSCGRNPAAGSKFGPELLRLKDRHERDFCLGPTHEEVITDIARNELKSYRQLPVNFYQIQTKFRDELRPRFGVMRAREFLMKDAYSFHLDEAVAAGRATTPCTTPTRASSRASASSSARWPPTPARSAAAARRNSRCSPIPARTRSRSPTATTTPPTSSWPRRCRPPTPRAAAARRAARSRDAGREDHRGGRAARSNVPAVEAASRRLLVDGTDGGVVALLVRGDHELNEVKAQKLAGRAQAAAHVVERHASRRPRARKPGFLGPVGFKGKIYADHAVRRAERLRLRRQQEGRAPHRRQLGPRPAGARPSPTSATWCRATRRPTGKGTLAIARGIEVGHVFQLGRKYSEAMDATVLDENGKAATL